MPAPRAKGGKPASDNPVLQALGAQLAQRRRDAGRLQQEVADTAGVSRSTLHTIERGGEGVRWEKVLAVAKTLGLSPQFVESAPDSLADG
ncbi:transcriptional regulator [Corynebacterium yudongzhengii]|uniref:XRE family transcriptional regulator n=1 Tax=Corynebacterium yudongzhengii TaxID=2080740 RepID=A0A2U1TA04_9CORY|nr:transcriptional regulator [Corynebacterium yudongzhengii]PWC02836.1 XRE family transcriptional regulator [Corynebacterium yudongzhengii]